MHHSQNQKYNRLQRNALELIVLLASAFRPQEKSLISEWAEKNRVVSREESSRPGAWDNSLMPFIVQPMNDFVDPEVEQISVMAPAQLFKTELIKNVIAYTIDAAPCPVMYVGPTEKYCLDFSREKLAPMIAANRCLREKVGTEKHRKSASTTNKQFIVFKELRFKIF